MSALAFDPPGSRDRPLRRRLRALHRDAGHAVARHADRSLGRDLRTPHRIRARVRLGIARCGRRGGLDGDLGAVVAGIDYRIVGDDGAPGPRGIVGELELRGPNVTPGYWSAPEATAAAFHDGWLRTGDLVREIEPRRLAFAGRAKDVIVSGGNTIHPPEIERVLLEHPDVARAAVVGLPDALLGEMVVAAVEPHPARALDPDALATWLAERVAPYQRPRRIEVMALPTSADLKVKRRLVAEQLARG